MGRNSPHSSLDRLPPLRGKVETIEILRQTNESTAALAELKGTAKTMPNQVMLINALVLQEAGDSSEIENIVTTRDELYKAITVNKTSISAATKEVVNYRKALFYGFALAIKQGYISIDDIVSIQQELVNNTAGLRSTPGAVLRNEITGEVIYTPPQDKNEILELLTNYVDHFNQKVDLPPLINLAVLHYQFESIQPFYDGNGRIGSILNILYLILNELIDVPILYLSSYIIDCKPEYHRLLNQINITGNWEEWILFMLKAVEISSRGTNTLITNIKDNLDSTILKVQEKAPKLYRKELVELIFEQPYSKIEFVVNKLGVERKAASRYLKELEKIGILESQKAGREMLYINKELIEILDK